MFFNRSSQIAAKINDNMNHSLCDSNKLLYKRCVLSMGRPKGAIFDPRSSEIFSENKPPNCIIALVYSTEMYVGLA